LFIHRHIVQASRKGALLRPNLPRPAPPSSRGQEMEGIQLEIKGTLLGMLSTTVYKYKGKKIPG
jgi:hypothetical protein